MKKLFLASVLTILTFSSSYAHTPLMECYNNGDRTITCLGGFSDGSSASGIKIYVISESGRVLVDGELNENDEFTFDVPRGGFKVVFDAGAGHRVEIRGTEISQ